MNKFAIELHGTFTGQRLQGVQHICKLGLLDCGSSIVIVGLGA